MSLRIKLGIVINFERDLLSHVLLARLHRNRRLTRSLEDRLLAGEPLVPIDNDVGVRAIKLHQERIASRLLSADQG